MRQLCLGKMDLLLHRKLIIEGYDDLEETLEPLIKDYRPKLKTTPPTIARQFGHLFSDPVGYACAYYSYKWSEVLDADAFTRFQKEGIMNPETGLSFRECILSKGIPSPPKNSSVISWVGTPSLRPCSSAPDSPRKKEPPNVNDPPSSRLDHL